MSERLSDLEERRALPRDKQDETAATIKVRMRWGVG
jgi:hypothetical protein